MAGSERESQKLLQYLHFWIRMTEKELCNSCSTEILGTEALVSLTAFSVGMSDGYQQTNTYVMLISTLGKRLRTCCPISLASRVRKICHEYILNGPSVSEDLLNVLIPLASRFSIEMAIDLELTLVYCQGCRHSTLPKSSGAQLNV